jgi:hypothetical protein
MLLDPMESCLSVLRNSAKVTSARQVANKATIDDFLLARFHRVRHRPKPKCCLFSSVEMDVRGFWHFAAITSKRGLIQQ